MKTRISLLFFLFTISVFARDVKSNHSYQALGFTRLPAVTFGLDIDGMITKTQNNSDYNKFSLPTGDDPAKPFNGEIANKFPEEKPIIMAMDSDLVLQVHGVNDFGFNYGFIGDLSINTGDSYQPMAKKSYLYGEFIYGKIEFGAVAGASKKLKVDPTNLLRNENSGIGGNYLNFVNLPISKKVIPLYILTPQHPTSHGGFGMGNANYNDCSNVTDVDEFNACMNATKNTYLSTTTRLAQMENALKISYYTPEYYGFVMGVSFTPDTDDNMTNSLSSPSYNTNSNDDLCKIDQNYTQNCSTGIQNVMEAGVNFSNTFYGIGISLGATAQQGESKNRKIVYDSGIGVEEHYRDKLNSIQYGGVISYYGLSFAGSMGNWEKSLQPKAAMNDNGSIAKGEYMALGASYEFGPLLIAGTYLTSTFWGNEYTAASVTADYKLSKSFLPYVEVTSFKFKTGSKAKIIDEKIKNNEGMVITAGFVLSF